MPVEGCLDCSAATMRQCCLRSEKNEQEKQQIYNHKPLERIPACLVLCLVRSCGRLSWKEKWRQRACWPPRTESSKHRRIHSDVQGIDQVRQKVRTDKQGTPDWAQMQKGGASTGHLSGTKEALLVSLCQCTLTLCVLGWRSKSQSRVRVGTQSKCQGQEEKLIEIHWWEKERWAHCCLLLSGERTWWW